MKQLPNSTVCILLIWILINLSCKKEYSCEGCSEKNKPPIANAGPDQVITLPTDSASLDGRSSSDPDGKISAWLWTKISGPVSFNIVKTFDSTTKVKTLVAGIYQFELKVTDNGGLSAKDTVGIIVDAVITNNHPPIANAGPDTTITLPANTINLDGSGSTDPDNNITSYMWAKISGPSSFSIINASAIQTQATNLVEGIYQLELKVTDAGGLFSRDTTKVTVLDQPPTPQLCDNSNRPQIYAQLIPFGTLSQARAGMAVASAGNKIVFAAGRSLSQGYYSSRVDVYDIVSQTWSTAELSVGRMNIAAVAAGHKIFFAGGELDSGGFSANSSTVDIYDVSTNAWSLDSLSEPRSLIAAAAVGNKVVFSGGEINDWTPVDQVDNYDIPSNSWSTAQLSEPRKDITAVAANNKIYFAGGSCDCLGDNDHPSDKVDIYDNATGSWSTSSLIEPKTYFAGIAVANKIYWAGGYNLNSLSCNLEIKDLNTQSSSIDYLLKPTVYAGHNGVVKDNKIIFFNGSTDQFDIYDVTTNLWSIGVLPVNFNVQFASIIVVNNIIYVAGGAVGGDLSNLSNQVWKLEF